MNDESTTRPVQDWLKAMLANSLSGALPAFTPRIVHGRVRLPGKATAVVGMRRAGKTTFLHQQRQERLDSGTERDRLPYLNFEDERLIGLTVDQLHPMVEDYYRGLPELRGRATAM